MSREEISRKKRQLSEFLCREMMYDYISDRLDEERKQAMDEFLAENTESRRELAALREGLNFCQDLSQVEVARPVLERIKQEKALAARIIENLDWRTWPDVLRWSAEALVISLVLSMVVVLIPWSNILDFERSENKDVVLAERDDIPSSEWGQEGRLPPEYEDSEESLAAGDLSEDTLSEEENFSQDDDPQREESEPKAALQAGSNLDAKTDSTADSGAEPKAEVALKGEIYRAFMNLENVDEITEAVTERIVALGGTKAGEVKLGWRRPQGSYYHFTIPEANHDSLLAALGEFGPVRVFKNPHWRVMPEGTIRFILWLERVEADPEPSSPEEVKESTKGAEPDVEPQSS